MRLSKSLPGIAVVVAPGAIGLAGCGGGITVDGEVKATAPVSDGVSALGEDASSGECTESASGIATGDTVTISSGNQTLATGDLETGEFNTTGLTGTCVFPFTVSGVEPGHESYTVSVQDESLTYSEEELRDGIGMVLISY